MKKVILALCAVTVLALCGCTELSKYSFVNNEEFQQKAIDAAESYANKLVEKKINQLVSENKITAEYGETLKKECNKHLEEAFKKIDELYTKYKEAKATKAETTADTKVAAKPAKK